MRLSKLALLAISLMGYAQVYAQQSSGASSVTVSNAAPTTYVPKGQSQSTGITIVDFSLEDAVRRAMSNYPQLLMQLSNTEAADAAVNQAWGALSPTVGYNYTNQRFTQNANYYYIYNGPTASLNLFSGGKHVAEIARSKYALQAEKLKLTSTQDDVGAAAAEAYVNWARAIKTLDLSKRNVVAHEQIIRDVSEIVSADKGRRMDLNQALVRLDNAKLSREQAISTLETAKLTLAKFTGGQVPRAPSGMENPNLPMPKTMDEALSYANDQHPLLASGQASVEAANAAVWGARGQYFPTVDLGYGKGYNGFTGQYNNYGQVTVSAPLFNGFQALAATDQAKAKLRNAQLQLDQSKAELKERIAKAYSEYMASKGRANIGGDQARIGDQLVEGYYLQFRVGRRTLLELLNITAENYQYQTSLVNAQYDSKLIAYRLAGATGLLSSVYGTDFSK